MICLGLIICLLSLMSAAAYAANGSPLLIYVSLVLLVIGAGLAIPAAVKLEREGKQND